MKDCGCYRQELKKALKITGWMALMILPLSVLSQKTFVTDSTDPEHRTVIAGHEYKAGGIYQFLWGKHYRKEWITPVKVPVIHLDKEFGGLVPIEQGGGRQTKTLRLEDSRGKQYVLRSIDKNYAGALPEIIQGTFLEDLSKDIVSTAHPYSSITIPGMIKAAGVYHTNPKIVFVPYTPVLGKYNEDFANMLCLFEERPADNQEDAANFGKSKDVKGTEKMFEKIFEDNDKRVDQRAFVRARLFDMFLGDWGRHDDQWRWAEFDSADYKIYRPIPRDRDQAFTKFDGFLLSAIMGNDRLNHMQTFRSKIKDVNKFNFPARHLDRQLTNEVSRLEWIDIAKQLQQALSDQVIENGIKQLPPEVFPISGPTMISNLKSRRNDLVDYAIEYYEFLSDEVEIVGTEKSELFQVNHLNDRETELRVYDLKKDGEAKKYPFYTRIFDNKETEEIRLYGLQGNDIFRIEGASNDLNIRVIGGDGKDSVINNASERITYYDNREENIFHGKIRKKLSVDSANNAYNYKGFNYNSGGLILMPSFTNLRGIHILAGYGYTKEKWRKEPFGWKQSVRA